MGPLWREMPVSKSLPLHILQDSQSSIHPPGFSCRAPIEREIHLISRAPHLSSRVPDKGATLQVLRWGPCGERDACFQSLVGISWSPNKQSLLIKHNLTFLSKSVKKPLSHVPTTAPLWREMLSFQNQWFIQSFISLKIPQLRSSRMNQKTIIWSLPTGPHTDRRPVYGGVQPGSQKGLFVTLVLLPQCHAAFSTTSTLV